jgi:hypothetical protein
MALDLTTVGRDGPGAPARATRDVAMVIAVQFAMVRVFYRSDAIVY